jgi:receptor kinase-like protein
MAMGGAVPILCFSLLLSASYALESPGKSSNATGDQLSLLFFKSMLSSPSEGLLASWISSSPFCSWPGVVCGRRHPGRVVALRLGSSNLSGRLSPFLGNLSFLKVLDLHDNHLIGQIPPELGHLTRLQVLNLSTNSLQGGIPVALVGCTNLTILHLSDNQLQGQFPSEIGANLKNLVLLNVEKNGFLGDIPPSLANLPLIEVLNLRVNRFSGEIPPALSNLTNLRDLALDYNKLSGTIPSSLGKLSSLYRLTLSFNNLTGLIPSSIWNMSSLMAFTIQQNSLSGSIPPNAFDALPSLQLIGIDHNKFHGSIPASIANASDLWIVQLGANPFTGIIPPEIGRLRNLQALLLAETFLEDKEPNDWKFITALANCSRLRLLYLSDSNFEGVIPASLSNLSTTLTYLDLSTNKISGSIPRDIGNLLNLQTLNLSNNYITGALPSATGRLQNLQALTIENNNIGGPIPLTLGNLSRLTILDISSNVFTGSIPSFMGNLTNLLSMNLASNNFTGQIPRELFSIPTLSGGLDLSDNNLEGAIPLEIGNLKNIVVFHAESNKLSGEIPDTIGQCQLLQNLYLQHNFMTGSIPPAMSQLKAIETLDLSSNNLSGQIPKFMGALTMLDFINISFNNFAGEVPTIGVFENASRFSVQGNRKLCGGISDLHLPPCSSQLLNKKQKLLVVPIVIPLVATLVILLSLYVLLSWCKRSKTKTPKETLMQGHPLISYSELVKATDGFSPTNLLGSGSFGSVYRGELDGQDGESKYLVAVKVLKLQTPGAHKSFVAECEALRNMRHRNLLKIVTACASIDARGNDFKAIVYDLMPNRSLEFWLHRGANDQTKQRYLDLTERVTILLDVAYALDYLHCDGPAPVIHCDLKSSNVLLDADMVAHVGDFGLAKIIVEGSSIVPQSATSLGLRGTIGYAAPG